MRAIAAHVRAGALAYLQRQYRVVGLVFAGLTGLFCVLAYGLHIQNPWVPFAFLTGGFFSGLAGFIGMKTATYASARTANAARDSLNHALRVAFRSGAVMGLSVVGGLPALTDLYMMNRFQVTLINPRVRPGAVPRRDDDDGVQRPDHEGRRARRRSSGR